MYKWLYSFIVALTVIVSIQPSHAYASTETVNVTYEGTDYEASDGFRYSDQSSREATFNIPEKTGFVIKSVRWEALDGSFFGDAAGDWTGKKSFIGTDTINGTPVLVKTTDTESYGGIFYWSRSGGTSLWKAVMSNGDNVTSSGCPSAPSDSWGYKMYPNCNTLTFRDDALSLVLKKKGGYYIGGLSTSPIIIDDAVDLNTIAPAGVSPDFDTDVKNEIYGGKGKADPSTHYLNKYDVISKTSIRAYFNQEHDCSINGIPNSDEPVCKYKDFANPGAKQMWWYSALKFQLQATTYRYLDKRLVVEWMPEENEITEIKVRHMVRLGPTGTYAQAAQTTTTLADPLPLSRTISADSSYGTVKGRNVSYASFNNSILNGTQVTVNLSSTQKTAYVTFFYEKPAPQFTGDFDIVPSVIEYRDSFSFVPKDFVMNGCAYQS
uniref:hypothetical protein n=1 Tax=Paenibacillus sp. HB172176 TaxID=2493690 RepID=UPI00143B9D96